MASPGFARQFARISDTICYLSFDDILDLDKVF